MNRVILSIFRFSIITLIQALKSFLLLLLGSGHFFSSRCFYSFLNRLLFLRNWCLFCGLLGLNLLILVQVIQVTIIYCSVSKLFGGRRNAGLPSSSSATISSSSESGSPWPSSPIKLTNSLINQSMHYLPILPLGLLLPPRATRSHRRNRSIWTNPQRDFKALSFPSSGGASRTPPCPS